MSMAHAEAELNPTWTNTTTGKMAQREFPYQRMHREPAPPMKQAPPESYRTEHTMRFLEGVFPKESTASQARYTVGEKNALGTHATFRKVTRDELRVNQVPLAEEGYSRAWDTTFSSSFAKPDQSHALLGAGAPRGGKAPRLPFSDVERNFGSLTSEGTMPGTVGVREGTSESRSMYRNPGPQATALTRNTPNFLTLGYGNDIGSQVAFQKTPTILANDTHYSLGEYPRQTVSETTVATSWPVPSGNDRLKAAGEQAPLGVAEVERGFRQAFNSRHYNIISNGPRLHGELNAEAALHLKQTKVHDPEGFYPCGRKQHPTVDPRDRGPTGLRQSYDIITGVDRPKERW